MALIHGTLKRAILERIRSLNLIDLDGQAVQVAATLPPDLDRRCVFGGTVRWVQTEATAERALVMQQVVTVEIRIRVEDLGGDIDAAERVAERIQAQVASGVCGQPHLLENAGTLVATSGDSDPTVVSPDPDPRVIVNMGLVFTATALTAGV